MSHLKKNHTFCVINWSLHNLTAFVLDVLSSNFSVKNKNSDIYIAASSALDSCSLVDLQCTAIMKISCITGWLETGKKGGTVSQYKCS